MSQAGKAKGEIRRMEELAAGHSIIHDRSPLAKLFVTIVFLITVQSFGKYEVSGVVTMILPVVFAYLAADTDPTLCFYKMRYVFPLVLAMGILQPFLDHSSRLVIGGVTITGGVLSLMTLVLKGVLCLMASFLFAATTPVSALCLALEQLHVPRLLSSCLLLTVRYVGTLLEQVQVMWESYSLRAPGQRGIHPKAWGSFLGQLLLRSMDKAENLYFSMCLRGFRGMYPSDPTRQESIRNWRSLLFLAVGICLILCLRYINLAEWIGGLL